MRVCTEHKSDLLFMKERFTLFMSGKTKNLTNKFILHFFSFAFIKKKEWITLYKKSKKSDSLFLSQKKPSYLYEKLKSEIPTLLYTGPKIIWISALKNQETRHISVPTVTGSVFRPRIRIFLGTVCVQFNFCSLREGHEQCLLLDGLWKPPPMPGTTSSL